MVGAFPEGSDFHALAVELSRRPAARIQALELVTAMAAGVPVADAPVKPQRSETYVFMEEEKATLIGMAKATPDALRPPECTEPLVRRRYDVMVTAVWAAKQAAGGDGRWRAAGGGQRAAAAGRRQWQWTVQLCPAPRGLPLFFVL